MSPHQLIQATRKPCATGWITERASAPCCKHLLDEPLPSGVGWWFVTGSIVLFLLTVQLLTGVLLAIFYSPSPDYAYDSVRFIMERVTFGRVLRGLHFFGASFIVIAAVVHMLRVVAFGSYKKPRELNWMVGVLLLLIILAFALTGYLLPWDQKAYWATTVTLNIARSVPLVGDFVSGLLKGGTDLGALTLMRWYAAHVFLLPACLIVFTVAHIYLMRRHGISGPVKAVPGPSRPFYPYQATRDTIAIAVVFALLLTLAIAFNAPLDALADPTDATYVPRPEWYFMSLFELLKHFPGPLEPVATVVIPGLVITLLFLLPFLDRRADREPARRPLVISSFVFVFAGIAFLTVLGFRSTPRPSSQTDQAIARGEARAAGQRRGPVMVEDVFKNVQALKGITVDEFMGTMGIMSASLGLCCSDCHPGAGTDKVVWESDENPRKVHGAADGLHGAGHQQGQLLRSPGSDLLDLSSSSRDPGSDTAPRYVLWRGHHRTRRCRDEGGGRSKPGAGARQVSAGDRRGREGDGASPPSRRTGKVVAFGSFGGGGNFEYFAQAPDKRAMLSHLPDGESSRTFDGTHGLVRDSARGRAQVPADRWRARRRTPGRAVGLPRADRALTGVVACGAHHGDQRQGGLPPPGQRRERSVRESLLRPGVRVARADHPLHAVEDRAECRRRWTTRTTATPAASSFLTGGCSRGWTAATSSTSPM